jgi:hypothetical protein
MAFYALDRGEYDALTFQELRAYRAWMLGPSQPTEDVEDEV